MICRNEEIRPERTMYGTKELMNRLPNYALGFWRKLRFMVGRARITGSLSGFNTNPDISLVSIWVLIKFIRFTISLA